MSEKTVEHIAFTQDDMDREGFMRLGSEAIQKLDRAYRMALAECRRKPGRIFRFKLIEEINDGAG